MSGHYLLPGVGRGPGGFGGGITSFLGEQKGGSVVTEITQICLENEGKGGGRESHQMSSGAITSLK